MDNKRLPTGSRHQGRQIRRYRGTLKTFLKRLQTNPANQENLVRDPPTWKRTVKTGGAIYEVNRIAAAKAKREACKSQLRPPCNVNVQPPSTRARCQRTFRTPIRLAGHLRTNCSTRTALTVVSPSTFPSSPTPPTNVDRPPESPQPSSPSITASTSAAVAFAMLINTAHTILKHQQTPTPPSLTPFKRTGSAPVQITIHLFTSHIGLVSHLRIHRTEPETATRTLRTRFHCPHCPRTLMHLIGLFGHMLIHENGINRSPDTPSTSSPPTMPSPTYSPPPSTPTATISITLSTSGTLTMVSPTHTLSPSAHHRQLHHHCHQN
nr:unnamed protein product [Spirometra erinaceieuropaei]